MQAPFGRVPLGAQSVQEKLFALSRITNDAVGLGPGARAAGPDRRLRASNRPSHVSQGDSANWAAGHSPYQGNFSHDVIVARPQSWSRK